MKPILPGGRGAAVEDIQRRLLSLGHDLGPTGVDGVFLGRTYEAVVSFQREHGLTEDGVVGDESWSALVDETFTLGDRMLYLRLPYFHGRDVRVLQEALSSLGFSCGPLDSIFGRFTERAVRELQRNSGLPADGIVGADTVRTIENLRHVWEGKPHPPFVLSRTAAARLGELLSTTSVLLRGDDGVAREVAERVVNLALADDPSAQVALGDGDEKAADVVLELEQSMKAKGASGPVVAIDPDDPGTFPMRLRAALEARAGSDPVVTIELPPMRVDEREAQRYAVLLLDALRAALA